MTPFSGPSLVRVAGQAGPDGLTLHYKCKNRQAACQTPGGPRRARSKQKQTMPKDRNPNPGAAGFTFLQDSDRPEQGFMEQSVGSQDLAVLDLEPVPVEVRHFSAGFK